MQHLVQAAKTRRDINKGAGILHPKVAKAPRRRCQNVEQKRFDSDAPVEQHICVRAGYSRLVLPQDSSDIQGTEVTPIYNDVRAAPGGRAQHRNGPSTGRLVADKVPPKESVR